MKKLLLLTVILISLNAYSQGYASVGSSVLVKSGTTHSISLGAGYRVKNLSGGVIADLYGVGKSTQNQFALIALDLRHYYKGFYLSLQPGWIGYGKTLHGIKTKGSFAGGASLGYKYKFIELSGGYQYTSFKSIGTSKTHQVKINLSFVLE